MIDLKNKNIIVTGASGGIGNSIIQKLNEQGANILATGTKIENLWVRCKSRLSEMRTQEYLTNN